MQDEQADILFGEARIAAEFSYSPYSRFRVGAALLLDSGEIIKGTNIENRSFGLTMCAERSALFQALSRGYNSFQALAIAGLDVWEPLPPCGACRQVISEFCRADMPVFYDDAQGGVISTTVGELLPFDSLRELHSRR